MAKIYCLIMGGAVTSPPCHYLFVHPGPVTETVRLSNVGLRDGSL